MTLRCSKCRTVKSTSDFYKNSSVARGYHYSCKLCMNASTAVWRANNDDKRKAFQRDYDLRRHYGMSLVEWEAMFEAQGRRCAICRDDNPTPVRAKWHTEHDHATGVVRGITCPDCNFLLRHCRENPAILMAAAEYLIRSSAPDALAYGLVDEVA